MNFNNDTIQQIARALITDLSLIDEVQYNNTIQSIVDMSYPLIRQHEELYKSYLETYNHYKSNGNTMSDEHINHIMKNFDDMDSFQRQTIKTFLVDVFCGIMEKFDA